MGNNVIRLTESDLNNLIRRVILESKKETKSEIINKISSLKSVVEVNNYFDELNNTYAPESKKLVLIFPGYGQYNIVAGMIYLSKINGYVFTSINDCINLINKLSSKGKSYEQIYIGSHGGGREGLLYSIDDKDNSSLLNGLVGSLAKITIPGKTKIIFSACNAADSTGYFMKRIAELTNSYVYASEGTYDWVMNSSERGFWLCPPKPIMTDERISWTSKGYNLCKKVPSVPFGWS